MTLLARSYLPVSPATVPILQATEGVALEVEKIVLVNTDTVARTFTLYVKQSDGISYYITPIDSSLPAKGMFVVVDNAILAGDVLWGESDMAGKISCIVYGSLV